MYEMYDTNTDIREKITGIKDFKRRFSVIKR